MKSNLLHCLSFGLLIGGNTFAQTWTQQNSNTFSDFNNIFFVDNSNGYAFGDSLDAVGNFVHSYATKTNNMGATWQSLEMGSPNYQIYSSYFNTANSGYAVGRYRPNGTGLIAKTINGGAAWTVDSVSFPKRLMDVDFTSNMNGWVCGRSGYIFNTTDAGATWNAQISNTPDDLNSIDFADAMNGWAVGVNAATGGTLVNTTDGGTTWTIQPNGALGDLFAVYAISATNAVAVGQGGTVITTTDGGITWTTQVSGSTQDLLDVTFVNALEGWAVGTGGEMIITTDGGVTWTPQASNTVNDITSISMRSATLGWYAGIVGDIYYFGLGNAGVTELSNDEVLMTMYPNPVATSMNISINPSSNQNAWSFQVVDFLGRAVKTVENIKETNYILDVNSLDKGNYMVVVNYNSSSISSPFIKY